MGLILPGQAVAERRCWDTSCRTFSGAVSPDTFLASFFFFHLFCSFVLFWIAVKEVGFYIGWIYTSVTQHRAYPETQLPRGDTDGRNNCACVCVCVCVGRGQLLPQPQLFTHFDLGKPEESFLASSLLVPSRSRTRHRALTRWAVSFLCAQRLFSWCTRGGLREQYSQPVCNSKIRQLIAILSRIPV